MNIKEIMMWAMRVREIYDDEEQLAKLAFVRSYKNTNIQTYDKKEINLNLPVKLKEKYDISFVVFIKTLFLVLYSKGKFYYYKANSDDVDLVFMENLEFSSNLIFMPDGTVIGGTEQAIFPDNILDIDEETLFYLKLKGLTN